MLIGQASWDVTSTYIKYSEKFYVIEATGTIISKPYHFWTPEHKDLARAFDYIQSVNLSLQTGVFFLLQCFWNYLSNTVAKRSFMSSYEFKFYIIWTFISMATFPILQYSYRNYEERREVVPQLAYCCGVLIASMLGIRSDRRFSRLLKISRNMKHGGSQVVEKLSYFRTMNIYLTIVLFFYGTGLLIICVDGLTAAKVINSNKFATDVLIANCNVTTILIWIVGISIFHPRRSEHNGISTNGSRSRVTTDEEIEMPSNQAYNSNNGSSLEGAKNNVNTRRLSQRITNFIVNKGAGKSNAYGDNKVHNHSHEDSFTVYNTSANSKTTSQQPSYMRAMSPVEADYSTAKPSTFSPTHQFSTARNLAVDDSYTNSAVNFTILDSASSPTGKYNSNSSGVPGSKGSFDDNYTRSTSPTSVSTGGLRQQDYPLQTISSVTGNNDYRFDGMMEKDEYDYLGKPTIKGKNNQDWLKQSPDRRI
ncbi:hypothetical protein BDB01DRAFT_774237 [Pilobolus umbonatus]|nr:hypothetical protein BDB01DRAFT_774237 [Pilobolus umbonatus]